MENTKKVVSSYKEFFNIIAENKNYLITYYLSGLTYLLIIIFSALIVMAISSSLLSFTSIIPVFISIAVIIAFVIALFTIIISSFMANILYLIELTKKKKQEDFVEVLKKTFKISKEKLKDFSKIIVLNAMIMIIVIGLFFIFYLSTLYLSDYIGNFSYLLLFLVSIFFAVLYSIVYFSEASLLAYAYFNEVKSYIKPFKAFFKYGKSKIWPILAYVVIVYVSNFFFSLLVQIPLIGLLTLPLYLVVQTMVSFIPILKLYEEKPELFKQS